MIKTEPNKILHKNLKTIKRSNKLIEALVLPRIININPRSVYNKVIEFHNFVKEESIDCIFMSESWEKPENPLDDIINLPSHMVISNPHQRKGIGGRPALFINQDKYHIRNLTQTLIDIPWGVEAVWALISPKNVTNNIKIKRIALCSLYSKPNSKKKTLLLDHISHAFNVISAKYNDDVHFIIAGDTNDLKLDSIINLSDKMRQLVTKVTRLDPPAILDPIISTLGTFYQEPVCLPPLDPDPDTNGKPADHLIVMMNPVDNVNNKPSRTFREVRVRPLRQGGMEKLKNWFQAQEWGEVLEEESVDKKAEILHHMILDKVDEFCPEKMRKLASDDKPWFTEELKVLKRKKSRLFRKNRSSKKYYHLVEIYKQKLSKAKRDFKTKTIDEVMTARSGQWYSKLKRISNFDQTKSETIQVDEISHLSEYEQAERIADSLSAISNEYTEIRKDDIDIPLFNRSSIPQYKPHEIRKYLQKIKTNKSTAPGDIPAKIIKEFACFICIPMANIINTGLSVGQWPKIYKKETITPIPKQYPPESMEMLRPISNLPNLNKIMEKIICEMVISDMKKSLDPSQYGNQKHLSIQHYLVRLLHRIVSNIDKNCKGEINAALCMFIDWKQAYSRQCHTLGVKSFLKNGVRPALIPILISYFQDREMKVKWHGLVSNTRKLPGGGAMGASLGNWEFLSQTNNNADCIPQDDRFKFVDDLSTLEIINLITIGLSSFNTKNQVPSDIPTHGQYINPGNLKSQEYLNKINDWSERHKMIISEKKTKAMIFNFTDNYKFTTRLQVKENNVEIVDKMKILGTIVNNTLSWDENCNHLIKKVNARMQLLRNIHSFGASKEEMTHLWIVFCRSVLEQSCVVWGPSLTQENKDDLERTQKSFAKMVLKDKYINYENAKIILNLDSLEERRHILCLKFAKNGIKHNNLNDLFPENDKIHKMKTRAVEKYKVQHANTERFKKSSIIAMQKMLNHDTRT